MGLNTPSRWWTRNLSAKAVSAEQLAYSADEGTEDEAGSCDVGVGAVGEAGELCAEDEGDELDVGGEGGQRSARYTTERDEV